jgi:antibiotic biosynthesis monooxygenase (ABM) superfamily enzyme
MSNSPPDIFDTPGDLSGTDTTVTKVVDRIPRNAMDAQLEQSIKNLIAAAMRFPGHLGVTVTRPSIPAQPGFRMVYRFDTCEHLRAWEESAEQSRLVSTANRYTQGDPRYDVLTGLEAWFTLPAQPGMHPPKRAKMTAVTWLGIFPLVYLYGMAFNWILPPGTPGIVNVFAVTALVVPTMSYVVAPRLTRVFRDWLYPGPN